MRDLVKIFWKDWVVEFWTFLGVLFWYLRKHSLHWFGGFENAKGFLVGGMYRQRGKYSGIFVHVGMVLLLFGALSVGPAVIAGVDEKKSQTVRSVFGGQGGFVFEVEQVAAIDGIGGAVLGSNVSMDAVTVESDKPRAEVAEYTVKSGDTLGSIAEKFGVSMDTIRWANDDITSKDSIKPGQVLDIPPVTGLVHTVRSGETIYSISKKYASDAQSIVDYPFNTFTNDETFALAIGQGIIVPDGVMPKAQPWSPTTSLARQLTPNAGAVSATGVWVWPTQGNITQGWRPWHGGIDIANKGGGTIVAADSGTVIQAGWPDSFGYGNRVMIDHGNGFQTLYAHMSKVSVRLGQTVNRGDVLGWMGSTGRSTGVHLHFEIRITGRTQNPLSYLK